MLWGGSVRCSHMLMYLRWYWYSSRTLHTLESARPQKYFTRQRSRLGQTGCHKRGEWGERGEEGNGNWASWLVRVLCLLWFRVELGVGWGGRICLGAGWHSGWVRGRGWVVWYPKQTLPQGEKKEKRQRHCCRSSHFPSSLEFAQIVAGNPWFSGVYMSLKADFLSFPLPMCVSPPLLCARVCEWVSHSHNL